jgi:hypothetical protein
VFTHLGLLDAGKYAHDLLILTSSLTMLSEMIPPISATIETTTEKRKRRTKQGLSEAPPTQPIKPEKNRVNPTPMTTYVNIWGQKN